MTTHGFVRRRVTTGKVALWALMSACGSLSAKPPATPDAVVRDFARALGDGQPAAAYALMSPDYRKRVSPEHWRQNFEANPLEVTEAETRLSRVRGPADLQPLLQHADGATLDLVERDGRWYIASDEIEFYDQSTPRAALRSFVAALTRRRFDVVLRLTPESDKEGVTHETMESAFGHAARDDIERLLSQLRAHLNDPIEVDGDRAVMPYAEHKRVQLVREAARWRIEEPE